MPKRVKSPSCTSTGDSSSDDGYDRLRDFGYVKTGYRREYEEGKRIFRRLAN